MQLIQNKKLKMIHQQLMIISISVGEKSHMRNFFRIQDMKDNDGKSAYLHTLSGYPQQLEEP